MKHDSDRSLRPVLGLFRNYHDTNQAVVNLLDAGFGEGEVSLLTNPEAVQDLVAGDDEEEVIAETAGAGAVGGGAVGALLGLLASAGMLSVPVIGPALATGALANLLGMTAAGAGVGAAYGGITGALIGLGVAEQESDIYVEGIRNGAILLLVRARPSRTLVAETAMREADAAHTGVYDKM